MPEEPSDPPAARPGSGAGAAGDESEDTQSMPSATGATSAASAFPARIGRYAIRGVLGEGGMGTVYEAEQDQPRRVVALKVIRAGHLSPQLLRRFEHESLVLGRLQHPGIAHVYEAGTIEDARGNPVPFFAMELIRGVPLTPYAARKKLGTRERLELIARICDAAYHAHQKGVIHRDLKPGNILVDESGQPKILDFGVARAIDSDMQQATLHTEIGQLVGTAPYMSPEQVGGDPDELDTRSDVYALGVVAYELLAGRLPYKIGHKTTHETVRVIRETEPTRLSSLDRTLRGDVETMVAKALEKDKARRYQSAEAFAGDIRRYLKDEPIAARPASTWYQLTRFSKRNKALVGGVVASFLILLAGIAGTAWQAGEARRRADELQKVSDFQANMLRQVDPTQAGKLLTADVQARFEAAIAEAGVSEAARAARVETFMGEWERVNATDAARALIVSTILKPAVEAIDKQFADQPLVDAALRQALADRYRELALYDVALPLQEKALATRRRVLGEEHPQTISSINQMGVLLDSQGKLQEAERYYREALEKSRRVNGEDHRETLTMINNMGYLMWAEGKPGGAEPYFREALEKRRRLLGEADPDLLASIANLGGLLHTSGKLAEAEPLYREALVKRRRILGEEHPETLLSIGNMGSLLRAQGRMQEAEPYYREALEKSRRVLGEEHPDTLIAISNMGFLLRAEGKLDEAELYYREALTKYRRVLGAEHPDTLISIDNLGSLLTAQGKHAAAEALLLSEAAVAAATLPTGHEVRVRLTRTITKLYEAWNTAEPGKGYDTRAAEWNARLKAMGKPAEQSGPE
ncbi:MAG TPA: serine/threonine-protein kinase [Verrucomicrobiae bacterium]|nr:serine/threonine-protein kinase [Verrucomicrobiae bacterium]